MSTIKTLYPRRKAISSKLIRKSKSHPHYFKYEITIQEKDGQIYSQPAYGKDMQDALSRLIWTERTTKVGRTMSKLDIVWVFAAWVISLVIPTILTTQNHNPIWLLMTVGCVISFVGGYILWDNYLKKE
jgi:hypothetical protein